MRVIAGELKGRRLDAPDWAGLRPTSDKLRGTLFNILAPRIRGARMVDGYAGTGAVGIEALSRGAAHVWFVEQDARAAALIAANLRHCGVVNRYAIIRAAFADLDGQLTTAPPDIVFVDPPYGAAELALALAAAEPLVGPETLLVVEHAKRDRAPDRHGALTRTRLVTSGDSALAFYARSA
ncbi:MAG: rRNA (guanine966-N2)-methyltransferase [Acidobacteriota bacterium]|jgi:16S rRNA (guanine(966)-N(2))-methyltransferase RsmD